MTLRIASHAEFHDALRAARADVQTFGEREPNNPVWRAVAGMLDTMASQTAGGREPTVEERRAAQLGALVDREIDPPQTEELADLSQRLKAINLYFIVWPDDGVDPEQMPEDEFLARL